VDRSIANLYKGPSAGREAWVATPTAARCNLICQVRGGYETTARWSCQEAQLTAIATTPMRPRRNLGNLTDAQFGLTRRSVRKRLRRERTSRLSQIVRAEVFVSAPFKQDLRPQTLGECMVRKVTFALAALAAITSLQNGPLYADHSSKMSAFDLIARSWVGRWSCTKTESGKPPERWTETTTLYGARWLKSTGTYPADQSGPATDFESVLGYDSHLHQWVTVTFLSDGGYGIDRSASPASALTQAWVNAYPADPKFNPPVTLAMMKNRYTVDGDFTHKGRRVSFHWDCRKSS
jgi:hypothetical protein